MKQSSIGTFLLGRLPGFSAPDPEISLPSVEEERSLSTELPDWFLNPPYSEKFYYGIGFATFEMYPELADALAASQVFAITDIAAMLHSSVSYTSFKDTAYENREIASYVLQHTDFEKYPQGMELKNAYILRRTISKHGVFTLMVLPREKNKQFVENIE